MIQIVFTTKDGGKKNPDKVAHNAAKHYALKRNAEGSHSLQEWKDLKLKYWNRCAFCRQNKPLSKDHIIPLTKGGANYISNIQPLCKNCNSKKSNKLNFDYKTYCNIQNMINKEFIKKLKETNLCNNPNEAAQGILFGFLISEMNEYPELENLLFNSGLFPYERFQEYQIQLCKTNESGNLELIIPLTGYDVKDNEFDQFISILETHNTSTLGHVNNQTGFSIFSVGREDLLAYYKTKEELNAQFNIEKLAIVVSSYYETADYPSKLQNLLGTKNIIGLYKNYVNN
jgi:5-methylcytosine-specific restriction endonuclease McrA